MKRAARVLRVYCLKTAKKKKRTCAALFHCLQHVKLAHHSLTSSVLLIMDLYSL